MILEDRGNAVAKFSILVVLVLMPLGLVAQAPSWVPPVAELAARRLAVMESMKSGVALISGARPTGSYAIFRQNNRFFYLTGLEVQGAYLLLDAKKKKATLLVPKTSKFQESWEGKQHDGLIDLQARTGIKDVSFDARKVAKVLDGFVKRASALWIPKSPAELGMIINDSATGFYRSHHPIRRQIDGLLSREDLLLEQITKRYPKKKINDLSPILRSLRATKSKFEQAQMRRASELTAKGMIEVIKAAEPERHEYELGAIMEFVCKLGGAQGHGYAAIVGSGLNSCVLHYNRASRKMSDGDIIVVDAACSYGYFTADVTRTFPANGKFSPAQKKVYNAVLEAQQAAIKACRPGVSIADLERIARGVLAKYKLARRFSHGLGHHVGMAVHDPTGASRVLRPGHIITIEPGAYIREKALGVRIEDVILITANGCEVLSRGVPRSIKEIEALMASPKTY